MKALIFVVIATTLLLGNFAAAHSCFNSPLQPAAQILYADDTEQESESEAKPESEDAASDHSKYLVEDEEEPDCE